MSCEFDYDLTADQWEALKALRLPAAKRGNLRRFVVEQLTGLELAGMHGDLAVLTPLGRKVLIRGSSSLWDVAA
jgi:hypothetical protein